MVVLHGAGLDRTRAQIDPRRDSLYLDIRYDIQEGFGNITNEFESVVLR